MFRKAIVRRRALSGLLAAALACVGAASVRAADSLVGTLEGPEIVLDETRRPIAYSEAPALAELVKAGALPPVAERLPEEPMVIRPLEGIGRYGGTWRRGFTGPGDAQNGTRINCADKILFWDYTGTKVMPSIAKSWEVSEDGRIITIHLRKGHKWSDGHPFTADDFMFWYEDIYLNPEVQPVPDPSFTVNGKPGRMVRKDDHAIAFEFDDPNFLFVDILAGSTAMGGGQANESNRGRTMGAYMPAHYLKQFHPKYASKEAIDKALKETGQETWVGLMKTQWDWLRNPDLPVLTPWKTVGPINTPRWTLERNPYFYAVDTEGNQLPYIDRISMGLAENIEVLNLRAIAGQYDIQERHMSMNKLPVLLENADKGNYDVRLDPAVNGCDAALHVNHAYDGDPVIADLLHNRDFRRALSLGIQRDQLNEAFWLGLGVPGSVAPSESVPYSPGPEWRTKWSTHDPELANKMLDDLGLAARDSQGYRMRPDGKGHIRIELLTSSGVIIAHTQVCEMLKEHWKDIGIDADIREVEHNLFWTRLHNNEHQIVVWLNDGSESIYLFPRFALPVEPIQAPLGPPIARWYATNGEQGTPPGNPELKRALELLRSAAGRDSEERVEIAREIWRIIVDEQISIGTVGQSPAMMGVRVVNRDMGNIPSRQVNAQHARTPGSSHPSTFYFKK